jgi:hypothetical protein
MYASPQLLHTLAGIPLTKIIVESRSRVDVVVPGSVSPFLQMTQIIVVVSFWF